MPRLKEKEQNTTIGNVNVEHMLERVPPQNIDAEMAVLGSMLLEEEAVAQAIETVNADHFYKDSHKKIFSALVSLFDSNRAADLVTLVDELKKRGQLDDVGGPAYLASLTNVVPTAANITHYVKIVREKAMLRNLIVVATQIVAESYESDHDADQLVDKAERLIFEIASSKVQTRLVPLKEIIKDSIESIDSLYQRKANVTGIPTGFFELDTMTAGLQASDLIVVAGRPSMGKSAFVASIAEYLAVIEKIPVAIFSLEMSKEQLVQRMLCAHARVDAHKVRTGFLAQQDWPRLTAAAGKLSEASIYIDDSAAVSVLELRAKARRLKSQFDIKMVVVDYLQLMQGRIGVENRQQEISEISMSLKALARELRVPVVAVSQLSRAVEGRSDHRPQLSDLRESGAIEQDADVVLLLLREEYYNPTEENKGLVELIIAKQRNGPVGSVKLAFIKEFAKFENLTRIEEE